jgi:putative ABC transport system permease protein
MTSFRLALRMLMRDLRAGELHLLGLALIIAVASLVSVGFLTDRVARSLDREATQLLGGDLLLQADKPWPDSMRAAAEAAGLSIADTLTFSSMVSGSSGFQLVAVKAVSDAYPLRGEVRIAPARNAPEAVAKHMPASGEIWPDERVMASLGVRVGDPVQLGNMTFRVGGVLTFESDRGVNFFSMLPRVMINTVDLPATGLIQVGSRVSYHLHLAGEREQVAAFRAAVEPTLERGQQIESIDNARPEVRIALDRAERFLRLAATLAVVLAAVAIGLSARRFMHRHIDGCAVLRCLGAQQGQLIRIFMIEFVSFGLAASLVGVGLAWAIQGSLASGLVAMLGARLPPAGILPVFHGVLVGLVLLLGFVLPHLIALARVPTLRVIRRELEQTRSLTGLAWGGGLAVLVLIVIWVAQDLRLGSWVSVGFVAALAGFALISAAGFSVVARSGGGMSGGWRYGFQALQRRLGSHVLQATALGLGLMALLVLTLVRGDLLDAWRDTVPADAPNRFVINLQAAQREAFVQTFIEAGLPAPKVEPMIRGRLVAINGSPVNPDQFPEGRARRLAEREFNLSYSADLPKGNTIAAGRWHGASREPAFSVESGVAETLGVKVGDTVTFDVAGQQVSAPVTSARDLRWDSMQVNFFFIGSPGILEGYPASLITSFHLPDDHRDFGFELAKRFPNVSLIDVGAVMGQVESMIDRLITVVELVSGFAVAAGVIVLLAALQSTQDERAREFAIMRALGARRLQLRQTLAVEFAAMGAIAGGLAGVGASLVGWLLASRVFEMSYSPALAPVVVGALVGGLGVMVAGGLGARKLIRQPPLELLRDAV